MEPRAHWFPKGVGRVLPVLLTAGLLGGCAAREGLSPGTFTPAEQAAVLLASPHWEVRGRMALKTPGNSGQGSFVWMQDRDQTVLRLAGPFGTGAVELHWGPEGLLVQGSQGEVRVSAGSPGAAEALLEDRLGWSLPLAQTPFWLRGLAGPGSPAEETRTGEGRPARLVQDGWQVRYSGYRADGRLTLPRQLELENGARRIRLVIVDWQF